METKYQTIEAITHEIPDVARGALSLANLENFELSGHTISNVYRRWKHLDAEELLTLPAGIIFDENIVVDMGRKLTENLADRAITLIKYRNDGDEKLTKDQVKTAKLVILERVIAFLIRGEIGEAYKAYRTKLLRRERDTVRLGQITAAHTEIKRAPKQKKHTVNQYVQEKRAQA